MSQKELHKGPNRSQDDYFGMSHSVLLNHLRTETRKSKGKPPANKIADFFTKRLWTWFYYYISSRFGPDYPYVTYTSPDDNGIYRLKGTENGQPAENRHAAENAQAPENAQGGINRQGNVCIALVADWGTDTTQSFEVASKMQGHHPDYTIHLGDTYYVGAPHEIELNFIQPDAPWVRGSKGSFALLGNHEMYARGIAFFEKLLPTLGIKDAAGHYTGQKAGFFCLENDHWRILGLDTGYHSIGKIPLIELLPGLGPDCHFDKKLMQWLHDDCRLQDKNDKRGLLILTHQQYITAFDDEDEYPVPAEQLATLIGKDRPVLWIWGHEHKFSMYEKVQLKNGITAYGRCIGHGGMPVELASSSFKPNNSKSGASKLVMVDTRMQPGTHSYPLGYNGYVVLEIKEERLEIGYFDVHGKLFSESWLADIRTGTITGSINPPGSTAPGSTVLGSSAPGSNPPGSSAPGPAVLKTAGDRPWSDAVK